MPQLFTEKPDKFNHWISHYQVQPKYSFDVFSEISAKAISRILLVNFVLYKIHMAISGFSYSTTA